MRILFVTMWPLVANTSASLRNHALIQGLQEVGCTVDVVTVSSYENNPFHDETFSSNSNGVWRVIEHKTNYQRLVSSKDGVLGTVKKMALPVLRKLYHSMQLFDHSKLLIKQITLADLPQQEYDCVISSSDPKTSHLAVKKWIKQGLRVTKWIQYWGDPLALDITKKHKLPSFYVRHVERSILQDANHIVYVSPFTLEAQQKLYPTYAEKMSWLPIPYAKSKVYPARTTSAELAINQRLRIGYFGDYKSNVRNILPLLDVCRSNADAYELFLAGNTDLTITATENIFVWPRISQTEIERLEGECDLLVCILNKKGTQIPGKIYHYAATNKPVLIILDGEFEQQMEQYFNSFERYSCCQNQLASIDEACRKIASSPLKVEPSVHFAAANIASQFLEK